MINLIVSIPPLETHRPPISSAAISSALMSAGHTTKCIDLNIKFYHYVGNSTYYDFLDAWSNVRKITEAEELIIERFIDEKFIKKIPKNSKIWISVFSSFSTEFAIRLCKQIRLFDPKIDIVVGGSGVSSPTSFGVADSFGSYLQKNNLCDHVIYGEGEIAAIKLANSELSYYGVNKPNNMQINNLNELSYPDYKDFDLTAYEYLTETNDKEFSILGSRGCVRKCTYCNVPAFWPKYRYREGKHIAAEMVYNYEKYGVSRFYFADSLINGSLKSFNDMCEVLADYNQTHQANFKWSGQFIFRPKNQLPKDHFDLVAAAGGETFYVGLETGSDKIRWEMDKKFTNDDVDYQLKEFERTNLKCHFLMITGYITETLDDHHDSLKMFKRWQKYVASNTITGIDLGSLLNILSSTPLEEMIESHGVTFMLSREDRIGNVLVDNSTWVSALNPDLTVKERIRRRVEIQKEAIKYNWPIWRGEERLNTILRVSQSLLETQENT